MASKLISTLVVLIASFSAFSQTNLLFVGAPQTTCVLQWNYPAAETHSNLSFTVYTSPSLSIPHTNWMSVTNFSSLTNYVNASGTNTYSVRVPIWYGSQYHAATADDTFWGKSFFSNDAWTNPLPRLDNKLRITAP